MARMIEKYGKSGRPFAIAIATEIIYVITDPKDVADIHKNEKTLTSETIARMLHTQAGISVEGVDKMFITNPSASHNKHRSRPLPPMRLMEESLRHHLSSVDLLDPLLKHSTIPLFQEAIDLKWQDYTVPRKLEDGAREISLKHLCIEAMVRGVAESFYGPALWKLQPDFVHWFMVWEGVSWKYLFKLPGFMSQDMIKAKDTMILLLVRYFSLPRSERPGASAWILETEDIMTEAGLNTEELGRIMMLQTWAILGNLYKATFWMVAYTVYDDKLLENLLEEILPATVGDCVDHHYLSKECPLLDSLFAEALRLTMALPLVRDITEDTIIGGSTLRKGNKIMLSYHEIHVNTETWGHNAKAFQADRFMKQKSLKSSLSYRPFGGGSHLCPGQRYAREACFCFMAMLLSGYDLILETKQSGGKKGSEINKPPFPQIDYLKPILGVAAPVAEDDIKISLIPRVVPLL
ncbi:cytochrome P450 [Penicillium herquei]|nr:cytochrome P450 [Penicillium herquei]